MAVSRLGSPGSLSFQAIDNLEPYFAGYKRFVLDEKGPIFVLVHREAFEVFCSLASFRIIFGMKYYFKAGETTVEVSRLPSLVYMGDWIIVRGRQAGKDVQLGGYQEKWS